jgi:hypothetical protein
MISGAEVGLEVGVEVGVAGALEGVSETTGGVVVAGLEAGAEELTCGEFKPCLLVTAAQPADTTRTHATRVASTNPLIPRP